MTVLDEQAHEIDGVGFAGVKGFMGGYGRGELAPFGEPIAKAFVDEAMNEARKLENQLARLRTERSVAVLHYSPIVDTIEGEPTAIFQYLGSQRLCDPIDRFDHVKAVVHGHAHHGTYEGRTPRGTPVYNVAQFVLEAAVRTAVRGARSLGRRPGFEDFDEARQPGVGLVTVHNPVVDGERHIGHRADEHRVLAIDLAHDDALLELADAEDRGLALVKDDRRGEQRARHAMVGDGEAAAGNVGALELAVAGAAGEVVELGADLLES